MKLPQSLLHSILVGITAGSLAACSYDVTNPEDVKPRTEAVENGDTCPGGGTHDPCPICGLG
jgi:hypothetical protein